jgi:hypothetical protein
MSDDGLPRLPPPLPPQPTTRIPRVFNIWGTLVYAGCSITAFVSMIAYGFGWTPPWIIVLPTFIYVGTSSGIIAMGRIQSNKIASDTFVWLRQKSEENKRAMRKMN